MAEVNETTSSVPVTWPDAPEVRPMMVSPPQMDLRPVIPPPFDPALT